MKRYALFAFSTYYPSGGWDDLVKDFDDVDDAVNHTHIIERNDNIQIVDLSTGKIVWTVYDGVKGRTVVDHRQQLP